MEIANRRCDWPKLGAGAHWNSETSKSRVDGTLLKWMMAKSRQQAEATGARNRDSAPGKAARLMDCRSWKVKEAGERKERGVKCQWVMLRDVMMVRY